MRPLHVVAAMVTVLASAQASAAGVWLDRAARTMTMSFPGANETALTANGHDLPAILEAFKLICLATEFDKTAAGAAAERTGWGFAYSAELVPLKPQPIDVGGWQSKDAALRVSKGVFFAKDPQCNLLAVPSASPTRDTFRAAALSAFGPPTNADKEFKKNGKPNERYEPEWVLPTGGGREKVVIARLSPQGDQAVHLALLERKGR